MKIECPRCGYEWESKIPKPKECPRCKQRLDSKSTKPRVFSRKIKHTVPDPLPKEIHKRVRDTQRRVDKLTARVIRVEKCVGRIEKKLKKLGDLFE